MAEHDASLAPEPLASAPLAPKKEKKKKKRKARWRPWLRAVHRDVGYVAVGLTFVYALSGLAVNHITDWTDGDPSFKSFEAVHELGPGLARAGDDRAVAEAVRDRLAIEQTPREV